jgi:hypothetical protein
MTKAKKKRKTAGHTYCKQIYPVDQSKETKSVGLALLPDEARRLGELLQSASAKCKGAVVDVTGWRKTGQVTVTWLQ